MSKNNLLTTPVSEWHEDEIKAYLRGDAHTFASDGTPFSTRFLAVDPMIEHGKPSGDSYK